MAASTLPTQMRAAQWTSVPMEDSMRINPNTPLPKSAAKLPKNSALIKVAYVSINPVDYKVPEFGPARFAALGKGPWTPGCDYAGTIVATTLPGFQPGDRVFGATALPKFGSMAEYIVVDGAANVARLPDGADFAAAAALPIACQTAMQCIAPYVKEGSRVLINGASGGTGTFGIQLAKILGCSVTAVCSGPNAELVRSLGADNVIDYKTDDLVEVLKKSGVQYDLIVDNVLVGGPIYGNSASYLKETGRYVAISGGPNLASVIGMLKMFVQPAWLGGPRRKAVFVTCEANSEELEKLAQWVAEGKLKPSIAKSFDFDETAEAFRHLKSGRTRGKLVIKVSNQ